VGTLAGYMTASSDPDTYGKLTVYRINGALPPGPTLAAATIDSDATIASDITLFSNTGSKVAFGNLQLIPIRQGLLYVQPLDLRAQGGRIPERKRVIVAQEGQVAMAETLDAALRALFGAMPPAPPGETLATAPAATAPAAAAGALQPPTRDTATGATVADLARRANDHYERARAAQRADDWATYGAEMKRLGEVLRQLGAQRGAAPR
jgi:uncharacterized membrane protein (UPF0182 family)